ncbi:hypothetical protein Tco_0392499 [Tanacetum coccineum]
MIGSLLYLTATWSDIMFNVCLCARFQEDPKTLHLEAVKRIFRYIKGTTFLGLWYSKGTKLETIAYADSDHAGEQKYKRCVHVHGMLPHIVIGATAQNTNNTTIRYEKKMKFVEHPAGPPDPETANPDTIDKYYESVNLDQEVACLMLSSMSPDLQRTLEKYNAYDMLKEWKTMFEEQAKQELSETVKAFHACKQEEGQSVSSYLLKMKSYLDILERLGYAMPNELGVSLSLNSLNKDYDQFVQNYNMYSIGKTIAKLHAMLKLYEKGIPKKAETLVVLAIREGKIQKDGRNRKGKRVRTRERINLLMLPCPRSHHRLRENIQKRTLSATTARRWVIGRGIGLRESRKLKHRALSLYMGNGMRTANEAIGSFDFILPMVFWFARYYTRACTQSVFDSSLAWLLKDFRLRFPTQTAPPLTPIESPPASLIALSGFSTHHLLNTPKSTPPPLTSPPPAPSQPSKHSSPLAINLEPFELAIFTPPTSPHPFFDSLEDLPPRTANPPPP